MLDREEKRELRTLQRSSFRGLSMGNISVRIKRNPLEVSKRYTPSIDKIQPSPGEIIWHFDSLGRQCQGVFLIFFTLEKPTKMRIANEIVLNRNRSISKEKYLINRRMEN